MKGYEKNIEVTENNIYVFFIVVMVSWMYKYITIHQIVCYIYAIYCTLNVLQQSWGQILSGSLSPKSKVKSVSWDFVS